MLRGIIFFYLFIFYLPSSRLPRLSLKISERRRGEKMEIKCFYCAAAAFILLLTDTPTSDVVREMQKRGEKHYDNTIRPKLFFSRKKGLVRGEGLKYFCHANKTFLSGLK